MMPAFLSALKIRLELAPKLIRATSGRRRCSTFHSFLFLNEVRCEILVHECLVGLTYTFPLPAAADEQSYDLSFPLLFSSLPVLPYMDALDRNSCTIRCGSKNNAERSFTQEYLGVSVVEYVTIRYFIRRGTNHSSLTWSGEYARTQ